MKNFFALFLTGLLITNAARADTQAAKILKMPQEMSGMKMMPPPTAAAVGGPFQLVDQNGRAVSDRDFVNVYKLIYFGFTNCPEVCPLTLRNLSQAVSKLGPQGKQIRILFITTDPARDTPAALKTYLSAFPGDIVGLTGSARQIAAVEKEYKVYAMQHDDPAMNGYMMDHSAAIYFMSPNGNQLTLFGPDDTAATIAAGLQKALPAN